MTVEVGGGATRIALAGGGEWSLPVGAVDLAGEVLAAHDPPHPVDLTNAIGLVQDHLEDVVMAAPTVLAAPELLGAGRHVAMLARVEVGASELPAGYRLTRSDGEDVFRTLVAENAAERAENPGLDPDHANSIIGTCCVILGVMRRLRADDMVISTAPEGGD